MTVYREWVGKPRPPSKRPKKPVEQYRNRRLLVSKRPDIEARRLEAQKLRVAGYGYLEIAKELGVSIETAHSDVQIVLLRTRRSADELADEVRQLDLERLDVATKALMPKVATGDTRATEKLVTVMTRRAALTGADVRDERKLTVALEKSLSEVLTEARSVLEPEQFEKLASALGARDAGNAESGRNSSGSAEVAPGVEATASSDPG